MPHVVFNEEPKTCLGFESDSASKNSGVAQSAIASQFSCKWFIKEQVNLESIKVNLENC